MCKTTNQISVKSRPKDWSRAVKTCDLERIKELVKSKVNPDSYLRKGGVTALMLSAHEGHVDVVKCLLESGANPHLASKEGGFTALMLSAQKGYVDVVKCLLESGANPHLSDFKSCNALQHAYKNKHYGIVGTFIEEGVKFVSDPFVKFHQTKKSKEFSNKMVDSFLKYLENDGLLENKKNKESFLEHWNKTTLGFRFKFKEKLSNMKRPDDDKDKDSDFKETSSNSQTVKKISEVELRNINNIFEIISDNPLNNPKNPKAENFADKGCCVTM